MIKQTGFAKCDLCGAAEEIRAEIGCYNEIEYWLPHGWVFDSVLSKLLCPECATKRGKNDVESYGKERD